MNSQARRDFAFKDMTKDSIARHAKMLSHRCNNQGLEEAFSALQRKWPAIRIRTDARIVDIIVVW